MLKAARNGAIVGAVVAVLVILLAFVPPLARGYPLALLPLLAAGPVSVRCGPQSVIALLLRGFIAGLAAAVVAVAALAFAVNALGAGIWTLVGPSSYPPMPPLPRPEFIPGVSWPQQDILLLLPPLSALLAVVHGSLLVGPEGGLVHTLERGLASARASIETKLVWLLLALVLFAVALGWVGFASLEDLHIQGHRFQLLVDWIGHANALGGDVEELTAAAAIPDPGQRQAAVAARGDTLARQLDHLEQAPAHSGIAISAAGVSGFAAAYRGEVEQLRAAADRLRTVASEGTADPGRGAAVRDASLAAQQAQLALARHLQTDAQDTLARTDLQHHTSLVLLLVLVAVSALAGVLLGQAAAGSITHPVSAVGSQLVRIGRGDFSPRVAIPNRDELGELAERLNAMTAELERLYAVEREGRQMAEALAEHQRELNTEREFWAHTIVHDLSSPLAVASGYIELLREGKCGELSPTQAEATREVDESLRQVVQRTQDIIDLFRLEQAGVPIEPHAESPAAIFEAAKRTSQQPGYPPIGIDAAPDVGLVYGDRRLLQRVVENLIANAYRHGGPGVTVTLRAWRDGEQTVLAVEDDGFGVPVADRGRVFELFQRASHSPRSSGLGLTFCKATVERHGGRIWIDDAPGAGTRVCFMLPLAPIPTAASASG